jgi:two-component system, LytTR family, response regulator
MIRAMAIDDEPLALQVLQNHAARLNFLCIEATFTNATKGLAYLQQHRPDALFLDIKMPDHNGLDIAVALPVNIQLVFTTAYAEHAVAGFELNATDYLLKPVPFARFEQACHKIKHRSDSPDHQEIMIRENGLWHKILVDSISFIEARGNYLQIVAGDKNYLVRQTMQEFAEQLPSNFCRIHKSYIINTKVTTTISSTEVSVSGKIFPVSPNYKSDLFTKLGLKG